MVNIRKAQYEDIDDIISIISGYDFILLPESQNAVIDKRFGDALTLSNSVGEYDFDHAFVAEVDEKIVGYTHYKMIDEVSAKTTMLTVLEDVRGMGVGGKLQEARMKECYESGAKKLFTNSEHPKSVEWYRKHFGYKEIGKKGSTHDLMFFRLPNKTIWGLHYGFKDFPELTMLECDLEKYFS